MSLSTPKINTISYFHRKVLTRVVQTYKNRTESKPKTRFLAEPKTGGWVELPPGTRVSSKTKTENQYPNTAIFRVYFALENRKIRKISPIFLLFLHFFGPWITYFLTTFSLILEHLRKII